ncbi:MAG: FIST C-terminal domain-containing protein [Acidobacteriota bacterium]|jgi:hypothetical protein|nr:FIST C-terminal domain-containing protein [Acidobacteriota bacterium]
MITTRTARTTEIDEIGEAVGEIKEQLDLSALKKYTGGLIFCHIDFVESGVVAALCEALPFDIIGMTSMASSDERGYGLYDLTLIVFTSDEVSFTAGMTGNITPDSFADETNRLYKDLRGGTDGDPAMIFTFMPYVRNVSGCEVVAAMDAACHGIPMWGAISNSIDFNYERVHTICNGRCLPAGIAMMFLNGPVEPKFIVSSIPERNISNNRAIVTRSEGAVLYEINDVPVLKYLANMGLVITKENVTTTPMMVYFDGAEEPVALGFYTMFDDGSLLTGDIIPAGTSVAVGSIDAQGIGESAADGLDRILAIPDRQAILILPCVTRYIMLAPDQESELRQIEERLAGNGTPFIMGYSGGEISPMPGTDGKLHNRFHNYTFCACVL